MMLNGCISVRPHHGSPHRRKRPQKDTPASHLARILCSPKRWLLKWQRGTWLRCDNAPRMLPRAAGITRWYDACMRSGRCASAAVLASAGALLDVRVCLVLSGFVLCDAVVQRRRRTTSVRPPLKQRLLMAVSLVKAHPWRQLGGHTVRFLWVCCFFKRCLNRVVVRGVCR
jgi:hypothetical protein